MMTEAAFEERQKRIESCLLSLARRSRSSVEPGDQEAAKECELAVASLAQLIHHTAFREDASNLLPLTEIAIHALSAEPPNLRIATDLIFEIEGRLFMRSEIIKYPFLSRWKLKTSTQRVSAVDIVTKALPLSFGMFTFVIGGLLALKWLLQKSCPAAVISGCQLVDTFFSSAYVIATAWGFFGGLASVMLRSVTTERLRMNQLRGLYYTTIYKPWLGSMFAVIVYFGVTANIVPIAPPKGTAETCLWGILGFAAGFGERIVPDLVTRWSTISSSASKCSRWVHGGLRCPKSRFEGTLCVLDYVKFIAIIGRSGVAAPKSDYPGFNRMIKPLVPDKQSLGKLLMENGGVRSAINMIAVNSGGVERRDRGTLRNVAALHQIPASPDSGSWCA